MRGNSRAEIPRRAGAPVHAFAPHVDASLWQTAVTLQGCRGGAGCERKAITINPVDVMRPGKGDVCSRFMSEPNLWVSYFSWHFPACWPLFLKAIASRDGRYEWLSVSSATWNPLTFQFTVGLTGMWSFDMNWVWTMFLRDVCSVSKSVTGWMQPNKLLSLCLKQKTPPSREWCDLRTCFKPKPTFFFPFYQQDFALQIRNVFSATTAQRHWRFTESFVIVKH